MANSTATDEEVLAAYNQFPGQTSRIAAALNMSVRAARSRCQKLGLPPGRPGPYEPDAQRPQRPPPDVQQARTEQRLRDEITDLRRQLLEERRELARTEDLRGALFKLAAQPIGAPKWTAAPKAAKSRDGRVPTTPVLFTSDFQWGERISGMELDGINEFNQAVAARRYRKLIDTTIEISRDHMGGRHAYPGIIYCRGGDSVSGEIHQELRETNDLQSIPAARDLTEHESEGIRKLADAFGFVHVISVPGNHGRTTMKPFAKQFVATNYDTLIAWWIESQFKGDKRVTFQTPLSGDALFPIYDWQWLMTHGDRIGSRGGEGFIGPAGTVTRGMKKLIEYYSKLGQRVDNILIGHFHTRLELEYGFVNGCLPGYSEYAKGARYIPRAPEQWLLFVHPKNGITARWPILLSERPRIAVQEKAAA